MRDQPAGACPGIRTTVDDVYISATVTSVSEWVGKIDPQEEKAGQILGNSRLAKVGDALQVTYGNGIFIVRGPVPNRGVSEMVSDADGSRD